MQPWRRHLASCGATGSTERGPINFFATGTPNHILALVAPRWMILIMERNPYYHAVDTATTSALPRWTCTVRGKCRRRSVIAQAIDIQQHNVRRPTHSLENEAAGDYTVVTQDRLQTNAFHPNISHPDPVVRETFDNAEFREALSIAINREELNELVYSGLLEPRQASPVSGSPNYDPEFESKWVEYNPDRANELLDGLGYASAMATTGHPDGSQPSFTITYSEALANMTPTRSRWCPLGSHRHQGQPASARTVTA
jgi:peptide/nickel transport system substrate-binding protein